MNNNTDLLLERLSELVELIMDSENEGEDIYSEVMWGFLADIEHAIAYINVMRSVPTPHADDFNAWQDDVDAAEEARKAIQEKMNNAR